MLLYQQGSRKSIAYPLEVRHILMADVQHSPDSGGTVICCVVMLKNPTWLFLCQENLISKYIKKLCEDVQGKQLQLNTESKNGSCVVLVVRGTRTQVGALS